MFGVDKITRSKTFCCTVGFVCKKILLMKNVYKRSGTRERDAGEGTGGTKARRLGANTGDQLTGNRPPATPRDPPHSTHC